MTQNWRTEVDAGDYFGHQRKQLQIADRRPVIRRASDLVGPGIATHAVRITDFNDILATFNGFYSAAGDSVNKPPAAGAYVGWVVSDAELGGVQMFTSLDTAAQYKRVFNRSVGDTETLYWGSWLAV